MVNYLMHYQTLTQNLYLDNNIKGKEKVNHGMV